MQNEFTHQDQVEWAVDRESYEHHLDYLDERIGEYSTEVLYQRVDATDYCIILRAVPGTDDHEDDMEFLESVVDAYDKAFVVGE